MDKEGRYSKQVKKRPKGSQSGHEKEWGCT